MFLFFNICQIKLVSKLHVTKKQNLVIIFLCFASYLDVYTSI